MYLCIYISYNTLFKKGAFQQPAIKLTTGYVTAGSLPPALQLHEVPSSATCQVRNAHLLGNQFAARWAARCYKVGPGSSSE